MTNAATTTHSTDMNLKRAAPTVLILGAHGRLGLAAARAFDAAGWKVLAQVRRERDPGLPTNAVLLRTPVTDTTLLSAQARGASVVVHALNPRYDRWQQEAMPLLHAGMAVAERLNAQLLLPGNVYAYGHSMPARLAHDTPMQPSTPHGRVRLEMEQAIGRRCGRGTLRATVLTAGDFFGAGRGSWFDQAVVASLHKGKLVYPGPLEVPHAWAYLPDLAAAMVGVAAADASRATPFERFMFAGHTLPGAELLAAIERAAQSLALSPAGSLRRTGMPWGVIRAIGLIKPTWRALAQMSYLWRLPHQLDDSALRARIGTLAATPLQDALAATLRDLFPQGSGPVSAPPSSAGSAATSAHLSRRALTSSTAS
jgi:nucleoside-diphosphate-sugar epimerase